MEETTFSINVPIDINDQRLVAEMERRGYEVRKKTAAEWITFAELARRVGRESNSLSRTIAAAGGNPPGLEIERGEKRIIRVRPSAEFFEWLLCYSKGK